MSADSAPADDIPLHRQLGVDLFNFVWKLLDQPVRTIEEDDAMLHAAHASRHHWSLAGTAVNLARGEWQISRVYSVLNRSEPALYHAHRCLTICEQAGIGDFDLAFAYEALARGHSVANNAEPTARFLALAQEAARQIAEDDDRRLVESDLASIRLPTNSG